MKKVNIVTSASFSLFLILFFFMNILVPPRYFSDLENRYLAQFPNFTFRNLRLGRFTTGVEDFVTDQFFLRDKWVLLKSDLERLTLKRENNGIFIGRNHFLLENYRGPNDFLYRNIEKTNYLARLLPGIPIRLMLVPNSVEIFPELLPPFASPASQREVMDYVKSQLSRDIIFINPSDILIENRESYIYFKTDHHWTMKGAYFAYYYAGSYLGYTPYSLDKFSIVTVSDNFLGTYHSRANTRRTTTDEIKVFKPNFPTNYDVYYRESGRTYNDMFVYEHLNGKDQYSFFLDGNHPLVRIRTHVQNSKRILVIKDSYAHAFIPFLANHYQEVHVVDLRHFRDDISTYVEQHEIDEVLLLFNVSTYSQTSQILR